MATFLIEIISHNLLESIKDFHMYLQLVLLSKRSPSYQLPESAYSLFSIVLLNFGPINILGFVLSIVPLYCFSAC